MKEDTSVSVSSTTGSSTQLFASKSEAKIMKSAGFFEAYMLGIGIALGGFSSSWTVGMECGVWEGFTSLMAVFVGFLMLNLCLSEMCSAVAFAGGSFGYVRCSLGPFYGFLAACTEVVQYLFYTVYAVKKIAGVVTMTGVAPYSYEPIWALMIYGSVTALHCQGGGHFWNVMIGLTTITIAIIITYFFGSLSVVNFEEYAMEPNHRSVAEDFVCYSKNFEYFFLCYMGVCALPLTASRIKNVSDPSFLKKAKFQVLTSLLQ
jgi:amino acid transporter